MSGQNSIDCRECARDLAHCHGTVIAHAAARAECTEPDCLSSASEHSFVIDCEAVGCACARDTAATLHDVAI
jgi:hypothetical protein